MQEASIMVGLFVGSVTAISGIITMYISIKNMLQARKERRSEYLERLLKKFSANKVRELAYSYDSPDGLREIYVQASKSGISKERKALDEALLDIEHLCYLKQQKEVSGDEFCFFSNSISRVLSDIYIQKYIAEESEREYDEEYTKFRYIKMFMRENDLYEKGSQKEKSPCKVEDKRAGEETSKPCDEITEDTFDRPTMIIKINKLYKDQMNDDEVYEVVRRSWRICPENANKYEVVLAVALGIVKGVYLIDKWVPTTEPDCEGRYEFLRKTDPILEKSEKDRFLGKSVKGLFPQGASNPIRYYPGKSNNLI